MGSRVALMPLLIFAVGVMSLALQESFASLSITSYSDVVVGRSAFLSAGTATTQFDWSSLFAPNAHTIGVLAPQIPSVSFQSVTLPDSTVNTVVGNTLNFGNWVDAPGFNGAGDTAVADLAINGIESFDLLFEKGHQSVGFAVISGTGNFPRDVDLSGASFTFTALDANDTIIGSASFALAADKVDQAWLTIVSDIPFRKLEVREIGENASAYDQYFSNILTSETLVPEPITIGFVGLGSLFFGLRRSNKI